MRLIFLRGAVPKDRDPNEIKWTSLMDSVDLWEHLACRFGDQVDVVYWGGERKVEYALGKRVIWVKSLAEYIPPWKPDVIFDRGGFKETHSFLKKHKCFKIYYGAGIRNLPNAGYTDYNLTLQDSKKRLAEAKSAFPNMKHILWTKPAIDEFYPKPYESKAYDVCYIANGTQAKIKGIEWVYQTVPKSIKVLHLGNKSKYKKPSNVKVRRVIKEKMPSQISRCKVGILPYSDTDSAPRALPEMLACNLPVVALNTVHINSDAYFKDPYLYTKCGCVTNQKTFWKTVAEMINEQNDYFKKYSEYPNHVRRHYVSNLSLSKCVEFLKQCLPKE